MSPDHGTYANHTLTDLAVVNRKASRLYGVELFPQPGEVADPVLSQSGRPFVCKHAFKF